MTCSINDSIDVPEISLYPKDQQNRNLVFKAYVGSDEVNKTLSTSNYFKHSMCTVISPTSTVLANDYTENKYNNKDKYFGHFLSKVSNWNSVDPAPWAICITPAITEDYSKFNNAIYDNFTKLMSDSFGDNETKEIYKVSVISNQLDDPKQAVFPNLDIRKVEEIGVITPRNSLCKNLDEDSSTIYANQLTTKGVNEEVEETTIQLIYCNISRKKNVHGCIFEGGEDKPELNKPGYVSNHILEGQYKFQKWLINGCSLLVSSATQNRKCRRNDGDYCIVKKDHPIIIDNEWSNFDCKSYEEWNVDTEKNCYRDELNPISNPECFPSSK